MLTNDTDADGNPLTAVRVTGPAHGTLTLNPNGSFTYTPTSSFVGSDSFTYTANDGTTNGNTATVTITDNITPTAVDVQATNTSGGPVSELDQGDTITFTFSEPIDPNSIVAGWDGTGSQNVVIRVFDTSILGIPTDRRSSRSTTPPTARDCRWARSTSVAPTTWLPRSGSGTSPSAPPGLPRR